MNNLTEVKSNTQNNLETHAREQNFMPHITKIQATPIQHPKLNFKRVAWKLTKQIETLQSHAHRCLGLHQPMLTASPDSLDRQNLPMC